MILIKCISFIILLHTSFANRRATPVFMIDTDQVMLHIEGDYNPFSKLTVTSFGNIIQDTIRRSEGVVMFIEDYFSAEDVSTKDKLGTSFLNLRNGLIENRVKYFPNVVEPYKLLTQYFPPENRNVFYMHSSTKLKLMDNFKHIYIFFQDGVNETRSEVLRRHDAIIHEVLFVVRQLKPGPVIGFYTGKRNPVIVQKIDFAKLRSMDLQSEKKLIIVSSGALFRFSGVFATTTTRRAMFNQMPAVAEETFTRRSMSTKVAYVDFELEFNFSFRETGWILEYVALLEAGEEVGRTDMGVGAPWNWSYICGEPLVIINTRDGSSVTISQYQIQPRVSEYRTDGLYLRENRKNESACFGESINCGPYFNTTILAGLFVSMFLLSITMYGIMTLFDCVANNRYEDPQGKPLVHETMH